MFIWPLQFKVCWSQRAVLSDICRAGPRLQSLTSLASLASLVLEISYSENGFKAFFTKMKKKSSVQTTKLKYPS
jgi:hypothetical protein